MGQVQRISRNAITPRREYAFDKLKVNGVKKISIPKSDPIAGSRALTAAYAYARRFNAKMKKADRIKFAGRISSTGKVMNIHRVR